MQVLALLRCRMPPLPTACSIFEGTPVTAAHLSCWHTFSRYHHAVGRALLSAAHAREAAHHLSTAAVALARVTALSQPSDWEEARGLALLMAACSALAPHMPLQVDRLMQFVTRLATSPSQPLPPLQRRLCEPARLAPKAAKGGQPKAAKGGLGALFSPFVGAAGGGGGDMGGEWSAFIEGAGLDAAVALLASADKSGAKLYRAGRLVKWMRDNGIVMPIVL